MPQALESGQVLADRIQLLTPLGHGGMGSVWIAEHLKLKCKVAVKFIAVQHLTSDELLQRFKQEAATAARIKHPHVVEIHDHGTTEDGQPFIVMELLKGVSLESRLHDGLLPIAQVHDVFAQTCKALSAAHGQGIVHRDLKPANVFLAEVSGYETFIKVLDFGIAKDTSAEAMPTATGAFLGTLNYMSPEQLDSPKDVDASADLWSLAVMAYEMLTGRRPFEAESLPKLSIKIATAEFAPPSQVRASLPKMVDEWFARALHKELSSRFSTLDEARRAFLEATESVVDEHAETQISSVRSEEITTSKKAATLPSEAPSTPRRSRKWALAALALFGLAAIGYARFRTEPSSTSTEAHIGSSAEAVDAPSAAPSSAASPTPETPPSPEQAKAWFKVVQSTIRRNFVALSKCYEDEDAAGRAVLRTLAFRVLRDGRVDRAAIVEDSHRTPRMDRCLVDTVRGLRFPAPDSVKTVHYPVVFTDDTEVDDSACGESASCAERGECSARDDRCIAREDSDCRLSRVCVEQGLCVARDGRCVAPSECEPDSNACKHAGLCEPAETGCTSTDESCDAATACKRFGLCTAKGGICVAKDDAACKASDFCKRAGRCAAINSHCGAETDEACQASDACRRSAACAVLAGRCAALQDAHCRRSERCTLQGNCAATASGTCQAVSDADCAASVSCKQHDACVLRDGVCREPE